MIFPFHDENPIQRTPFVTLGIVGVNAVVFLGTLSLSELDRGTLWYGRGFVPARIVELVKDEPPQVDPRTVPPELRERVLAVDLRRERIVLKPLPQRQILLSLFTSMFLHGGWLHVIGNMWFLWVFGNNVEDRVGHVPFLLFYLFGGLFASACHWAINPSSTIPVIGASGAVAAMLGAYAITWPWARVKSLVFLFVVVTVIDLPALAVLGVWFLGQLVSATNAANVGLSGGVAWWAHVGGFLVGLVLMPFLNSLLGSPDQGSSDRFDWFGFGQADDRRHPDDFF
jgi:membrane associated rhomboid family serine protease